MINEMTEHNLTAKIKRIHNQFSSPTPQVVSATNTIVAALLNTNKVGSIHIILGKTGSGCSTVIQMCRKRLRRKFKNIVLLRSAPLNEEFNPWRLLLQHYGLYFDESDLKTKKTSIPRLVIDLIAHAAIDCIIFEDFSEGLNKSAEKQQAVKAWFSIARNSVCVDVILSTHNPSSAGWFENEESVTCHRIDEWEENLQFSLFIGELQESLRVKYKIGANFSAHGNQLYKLCNGNTGNLLNLVREYAVAELLSPSNADSQVTECLSLKNVVRHNAILFAAKSSQ
ncbi:hypothetical protein PS662_03312 [Pseudomonas fluorescens]|uniref:AAA+ ATPase domain-containing protein n=2 Tax=Pseudomonas fluorescens TaxID=294 RepID=A0A5E6U6Q5_PSEFL|nr:hypothetical protein PS662_03312 [Pseudomonas fluorescens]